MMPGAPVPQDIDGYIAACPRDIQAKMRKLRAAIRRAAPGAIEAISYSMPAFKLHGPLVYFATFKRHIGFYPGPAALRTFTRELAGYETSGGTVRFYFDEPVPYAVVTEIVRFRVKANLAKAAAKAKRRK